MLILTVKWKLVMKQKTNVEYTAPLYRVVAGNSIVTGMPELTVYS